MLRLVVVLGMLPCFLGYSLTLARLGHLRRSPVTRMMAEEKTLDDAELDALVRKEIEAAFAGMEEKFATGDDDAALQILQEQGKTVLANVFAKLESDGQLLSSNLASQYEDIAADRSTELLRKYEDEIKSISSNLNAERANIRNEMEQLESLNRELKELQSGGGGGFNRNTIVGGAAFLVGLTGIGAAVRRTHLPLDALTFLFATCRHLLPSLTLVRCLVFSLSPLPPAHSSTR